MCVCIHTVLYATLRRISRHILLKSPPNLCSYQCLMYIYTYIAKAISLEFQAAPVNEKICTYSLIVSVFTVTVLRTENVFLN
jgi:hypothetical protein